MLSINHKTGWLEQVPHFASPNCHPRATNDTVSLLVIHGISLPPGQFGGNAVIDLFQNKLDTNSHPSFSCLQGLKVSAHLLIRRNGSLIQFVSLNDCAWHAGASSFEGRENCNDYSLGIELEGTDTTPYEPNQYQTLAQISQALIQHYPAITPNRIVGHSDIAPGRKTDPGPHFDWELLRDLLK